MADDADVSVNEITLDDFNADEQVADKAESSPAKEAKETKAEEKPEAKGKEAEAKGDDTPAPPDVPTKDEEAKPDEADKPEDEAEPTEDKPPGKAEERKAQLNQEIRDLVSQRNSIKAEVQKANAEVYQPATEDELTEQGLSATDAKVEALRQQMEMKDYNDRVADAQLTLSSEAERVLKDFAIFNPESEEYDKELAASAAELMQDNLVIDPNTNQVIGSNVSPYRLYETLARASGISAAKGQIKAQSATEKQLANADTPSNAAPPKKTVDPLIELWRSDD